MASYEQTPQDEGYSEDPMNVVSGSVAGSAGLRDWLDTIPVSQRAGKQ